MEAPKGARRFAVGARGSWVQELGGFWQAGEHEAEECQQSCRLVTEPERP